MFKMWKCCPCFSKTYEAPEVLELDYRHSSLTEVPADVFSFERTLEVLDLGSNQISDLPPSLFHCHELKELDLCDNDLMTIPQAVGNLTRLCKLDLSRNGITEIADTIKNCKSLVYFDLSMNHLTKLPEGISQLVNLEELFLNDTYLEFLHANFGRLTKLKVLELRENSLQSLPKSMSRLHNLQRIDIGQNDLSEMPEVVGTMTNLTELWCDNNSMRSIPKFIGNLTKLNCLDASQNEIQELAEEISKCTQLSDVTLNTNSLEGLPDSFAKLENITVLRLDCNSIQYLPEEFGNLKSLQELSIVSNILKTLPASIGLLRKLHTMYLDDNLLSELPKEIGSCTALSVLSVAKNRLKEVPSEVGHLSGLKVLTLSGNLIIHLPVSILNIQKLGALWLSESQSKPLLPLNKEIDPLTGQHVLTCYLLPQLPSNSDENRKLLEEESREDSVVIPRRSRPSIKFQTDMEPPVVENNLNKRGLLRAPTPYPKELRALAKHASHLRQSKELNGEVPNMDEPEYEGDYPEEEVNKAESGGRAIRNGLSTRTNSVHDTVASNSNAVDGSSRQEPQGSSQSSSYQSKNMGPVGNQDPPLPYNNGQEMIGLPPAPLSNRNLGFPNKSNLSYSATSSGLMSASSSQPIDLNKKDNNETWRLEDSASTSAPNESTRFIGLPDLPDKSGRETYGHSGSEMARKTPPPYHVAARRAAFFRSSGGAGSGKVETSTPDLQLQQQVRVSPIVGVRMFPLVSPGDHMRIGQTKMFATEVPPNSPSGSNNSFLSGERESLLVNRIEMHDNGHQSDEDDGRTDGKDEDNQGLNRTFTISREARDGPTDDSDIVSSMEENIDGRATPELQKESGSGSKSLAETIETALESVDKRTTEFLRNDGWEEDSGKDGSAGEMNQINSNNVIPVLSTIQTTISKSSNVAIATTEFSDNIKTRPQFSGIPSSVTSMSGYSTKGPAVPPKPSPLMSRNTVMASNTGSDRPDGPLPNLNIQTASANSSKLENVSKIPMFNSTSPTKSIPSGHSFIPQVPSEISNIIPRNSAPQPQSPVKNYSSNPDSNIPVPDVVSPTSGKGSKIPKLPTFSNTGTQAEQHQPILYKNPEVSPSQLLYRTKATTRLPTYVPSDPTISTLSNSGTQAEQHQPILHKNPDVSPSQLLYRTKATTRLPTFVPTDPTISTFSNTGTQAEQNQPILHKNPDVSSSQLLYRTKATTRLPTYVPSDPTISTFSNSGTQAEQHQPILHKNPDVSSSQLLYRTKATTRLPTYVPSDPTISLGNGPRNSVDAKASTTQMSGGGDGPILDRRPLSTPRQMDIPVVGTGLATKIPRMGDTSPEKQELKRSTSGSKIPMKLNETSRTSSPVPSVGGNSADNVTSLPENINSGPTSLSSSPGGSNIPSFANRRPWIFGTHRNARVVPVEYKKVNELGFGISDAPAPGQTLDGQGIYVVSTDYQDSAIKLGDKILQVDGIDVSNMDLEIVKKILGNCQENINLLVSRHN